MHQYSSMVRIVHLLLIDATYKYIFSFDGKTSADEI
jgi:hypothetical protein